MKKFNKLFEIGTNVLLENGEWSYIYSINSNRNLVKVFGYGGEFQRIDIKKFSNKKGEK